jgi:hypothetical protein
LRYYREGKSVLEMIAFVATSVAIVLMYISIRQTRTALDLQIISQRADSAATANAIAATREELQIMRESNEIGKTQAQISRESNELYKSQALIAREQQNAETKRMVDSERPMLVANKLECRVIGDTLFLFHNLENVGKSIASDVHVRSEIASLDGPDHLSEDNMYNSITPNRILVLRQPLLGLDSVISRVEVTWTWSAFSLKTSLVFYHIVSFDQIAHTCQSTLLSQSAGEQLWPRR